MIIVTTAVVTIAFVTTAFVTIIMRYGIVNGKHKIGDRIGKIQYDRMR
jgi:hypothetical protein